MHGENRGHIAGQIAGHICLMALVLFVFAGPKKCGRTSDIKRDTVTQVKIDTMPGKPVLIHDSIKHIIRDTAWRYHNVDTAAILQAYFTRNVYQRAFTDSFSRITLVDTVFQNRLITGSIQATYRIKTITNTIIEKQPAKGYLTAGIGGVFNSSYTGIPVYLGWVTPNKWSINAGPVLSSKVGLAISISKPINPSIP